MIDIPYSQQSIFIGAIVIIVFLFIFVVISAKATSAAPYERLPSILTPSEQHFYKVLSSAVNDRAIIMAKVRIADLLKVRNIIKQKHFWSYFSKISQKHIDFVLIEPTTLQTVCLIELDDKSHYGFKRSKRDSFVNQIMRQTEIPLYRFSVQRRYDRAKILQVLDSCLKK